VRDVIAIEFEPRCNATNSTTTYLLLRQQSDVDRASKVLPVSIRSCGKRSGLGKAYRCVCGGGGGNALSVYCGWRRYHALGRRRRRRRLRHVVTTATTPPPPSPLLLLLLHEYHNQTSVWAAGVLVARLEDLYSVDADH